MANPRTTKPFSNNLFTFLFARFSQSELLLTSSDGTVASSKDVERNSSPLFLTPGHSLFPVRFTEVFLHV